MDADDPGGYDPRTLDRTVIAVPLLQRIRAAAKSGDHTPIPVVLDLNLEFAPDRAAALELALRLIQGACESTGDPTVSQGVSNPMVGGPYLLGRLQPEVIVALARANAAQGKPIFRIWPDFEVKALLDRSISTVKADAAHAAYAALGKNICWAVLDTGVDARHPHFTEFDNLNSSGLPHRDFTSSQGDAARDANGHGTHVAGIIAGRGTATRGHPLRAVRMQRNEDGEVCGELAPLGSVSGVAPQCSIVSYKVLDDHGVGGTGAILTALDAIQQINDHGRRLRIHGINLSLGYDFNPEWFACGQSPLCVEVDRMVRSGVVVVVAAGNSGYAYATDAVTMQAGAAGRTLTINDPGNAAGAITVGSTHRDCPHVYGVSYFSSKGPTGDGRAKPDLVAPGERILSAAAGAMADKASAMVGRTVRYVEESGTSMAAPHVSGVIASFLSIRREFIGSPEQVKEIFTSTATDLGRVREFQGHGLIDAMRAIQSV
jgi:serine protease AprX